MTTWGNTLEGGKLSDLENDWREYNASFFRDGSINSMNNKARNALFEYFRGEGIGCPITILEMSELPTYLDNDPWKIIQRVSEARDTSEYRFQPNKEFFADDGKTLMSFDESESAGLINLLCIENPQVNREVVKKALELYGN